MEPLVEGVLLDNKVKCSLVLLKFNMQELLPSASMNCVNMSKVQMQKGNAGFTRNWLHL